MNVDLAGLVFCVVFCVLRQILGACPRACVVFWVRLSCSGAWNLSWLWQFNPPVSKVLWSGFVCVVACIKQIRVLVPLVLPFQFLSIWTCGCRGWISCFRLALGVLCGYTQGRASNGWF